MKKRILKKSEVLREGYIKGLKEAQRIIKEAIESQNLYIAKCGQICEINPDGYSDYWLCEGPEIQFSTPSDFKQKVFETEQISESFMDMCWDELQEAIVVSYTSNKDFHGRKASGDDEYILALSHQSVEILPLKSSTPVD